MRLKIYLCVALELGGMGGARQGGDWPHKLRLKDSVCVAREGRRVRAAKRSAEDDQWIDFPSPLGEPVAGPAAMHS